MKLYCPALLSGKFIPTRCASHTVAGGANCSLPLEWSDVPVGTKSFAISILHGDTPPLIHWIITNIPASTRHLPEDASRLKVRLPVKALELRNSFGKVGYEGPRGSHGRTPLDYVITVYALREDVVQVGPYATYEEFTTAIKGSLIQSARIVATYRE